MTYAKQTSVSADKSRAEIERTLARFGADQFIYATDSTQAVIGFVAHGRQVRIRLVLPDRSARKFTHAASMAQVGGRNVEVSCPIDLTFGETVEMGTLVTASSGWDRWPGVLVVVRS